MLKQKLKNKFSKIIIHICSSHFINTFKLKVFAFYTKKQKLVRLLSVRLISFMVHCVSLNEADFYFTKIILILGSENEIEGFEKMLQTLIRILEIDKNIEVDDPIDMEDCPFEEEKKLCNDAEKRRSPYYIYFHQKKKEIFETSTFTNKKNKLFNKLLLNYFMDFLFVYFPLWSRVLISSLNMKRDRNATAENNL